MLRRRLTAAAAAAAVLAAAASAPANATGDLAVRALTLASGLTQCGVFPGEQLWQAGSTLETYASLSVALQQPQLYAALFQAIYDVTPVIVATCYDDHQWWLLGWVRAFEATGSVAYLERAAAIHDYVATNGWETTICGGGVTWCPKPTNPYKNAITTELFITASARLHVHAAALPKYPAGHFLGWATQAWGWLAGSGMINNASLVNDGLNAPACTNNGQTTWSC